MVNNRRFTVSLFLVFASLTLVSIQFQNGFPQPLPALPAVKQVGRSLLDHCPQSFDFRCQVTHLRAKQKAPKPRSSLPGNHGSGAGHFGRWHGLSNIHDALLPAQFALARQVSDECVRQDLQQLTLAALRANCPSISHQYFTTNLQQIQLLFPRNKRRYTYPRDRKE